MISESGSQKSYYIPAVKISCGPKENQPRVPDHNRSRLDTGLRLLLIGFSLNKTKIEVELKTESRPSILIKEQRETELRFASSEDQGAAQARHPDQTQHTYDATSCCGAFCEGHVKCDCLEELIKVVKPGGFVCVGIRKFFLETVEEYHKLEPLMADLQRRGLWEPISRTVTQDYCEGYNGVVFLFKVN
ncbi:rRNA (guanine-N7)-methylation [Branchiostoma belcheri]|nr:rRNA (guanine-N7)-methylation [Branchiostoma belcheri]